MSKENTNTTTTESGAPQQQANKSVSDLARQLAAQAQPKSPVSVVRRQQPPEDEDAEIQHADQSQDETDTETDTETATETEQELQAQETDGQEAESQDEATDQESEAEAEETEEQSQETEAKDGDDLREFLTELKLEPDRAKAIGKMAHRVQKAQRQLKEAHERIQALETAKADASPVDVRAILHGGDKQLADISNDIQVLDEAIRNARKGVREGGATFVDEKGVEKRVTPETLEEWISDWTSLRQEKVSEKSTRKAAVDQRNQTIRAEAQAIARQHYAWVDKPNDPVFVAAQQEIEQLGDVAKLLRGFPQYPVIMGRYMRGLQAEMESGRKAAPPVAKRLVKPKSEPAKLSSGGGVKAPRVDSHSQAIAQARAQFQRTGTRADKQRLLELEMQGRT